MKFLPQVVYTQLLARVDFQLFVNHSTHLVLQHAQEGVFATRVQHTFSYTAATTAGHGIGKDHGTCVVPFVVMGKPKNMIAWLILGYQAFQSPPIIQRSHCAIQNKDR